MRAVLLLVAVTLVVVTLSRTVQDKQPMVRSSNDVYLQSPNIHSETSSGIKTSSEREANDLLSKNTNSQDSLSPHLVLATKSARILDSSKQTNEAHDQNTQLQKQQIDPDEQGAANPQPAFVDPIEQDETEYNQNGVPSQNPLTNKQKQDDQDESLDGDNEKNNYYNGNLPQGDFNTLGAQQGQVWEDAEKKLKQQEDKSEKQQLGKWIADQLNQNELMDQEQGQGIVVETFQVVLESEGTFNFRWNPPKSQSLHLKIMLFEIQSDGGLVILRDNDEDEWLQVSTREEGHTTYNLLGKIYIDRTLKINFDSDYKYFRLKNLIGKKVLAMVDLQKLQEVVKPQGVLQSDHLSTTVKKLQIIREEIVSGQKLREHSYKYEWGFLDNQFSHDSRLLGLTGVELALMIGAAIVQVYFIKSLLDNRAVV